MPAYFRWHNFKDFLGFFLSVSGTVQHKKKDKTIYAKGLHGSSVMFNFWCTLPALCICFSICSPVVPN